MASSRLGGYKPSYDETVKILLIGESSVGKSSLLIRFADDSFSPELLSTVGIDYKIKTLSYICIRVYIWCMTRYMLYGV